VTQTGANSIAEFYDDGNALAVKIADGGNVGIGTANPQATLHVNGNIITNSSLYHPNNSTLYGTSSAYATPVKLEISYNIPTVMNGNGALFASSGDLKIKAQGLTWAITESSQPKGAEIYIEGGKSPQAGLINGGIYLRTGGDTHSQGYDRLIVTGSGSVGIGTTQPQATLHVNGSLTVGSINTVYNIPKTRAQIILRDTSSVSFTSAGFQVYASYGAAWTAYSANPLYSVSITGDFTDTTGRAINYRIAVQNQSTLAVSYFPSTGGWVKYMYIDQNRLDGHGYHGIMSSLTPGASYKCQLEVNPNSSSPYQWSSLYGTITGIAWD
jgi:hypothetical protein